MGFRRKDPEPVEREEKAYVKDDLGMWPVDMEYAFNTYRNDKAYSYHGPVVMMNAICHIFYTKGMKTE